MTLIQSLILGIIQGLTEFLPISSSGHLVLVPHLLGWQIPESQVFPFDVLVQLGTLTAVIIYFWKDLLVIIKGFLKALLDRRPFSTTEAKMGWYLILATIPAVVAGVLIKDKVEAAFNSVTATALFLIGTALLLGMAELFNKPKKGYREINWLDSLIIGIFQILSLFPGVSRSGSTIAGGMFRKLDRASSARFSFLMSIPVMLGAGLVSFKDAIQMPDFSSFIPVIIVGFLAALLVGYLSIHWLLTFIKSKPLYIFSIYCILLAGLVLGLGLINKNIGSASSPNPIDSSITQTQVFTPTEVGSDAAISLENPLKVGYSPSISWIIPVLSVCTDAIPGLAMVTEETQDFGSEPNSDMIYIRWGPPRVTPKIAYQVGNESLAIIVNPANPLKSLTITLLSEVYSGQVQTWRDVFEKCPDCFEAPPENEFSEKLIVTYSYSIDQEPQKLFNDKILNRPSGISKPGILVPSSLEMVSSIEQELNAIGFTGSRSANGKVKQVVVTDAETTSYLSAPILAIINQEPTLTKQNWLSCIQKVLNP